MRFSLVCGHRVLMVSSGFVQPAMAEDGDEEKATNSILAKYDKGFHFSTKDDAYALRINGGIQVRWTYVDYEPMIRYNQEDYSNFFVRRATLYFTGHVGNPKFSLSLPRPARAQPGSQRQRSLDRV